MIIGIGVDIVDINSFIESFSKSKRFRQKVFTETEIEYCESKPNKFQHYAVRFAAKEAVMKAIGTGWDKGVQWKQIETINKDWKLEATERRLVTGNRISKVEKGKPEIMLRGRVAMLVKKMGVDYVLISLSHSETKAVAFVVIEGDRII